jgi:hypothetical protein
MIEMRSVQSRLKADLGLEYQDYDIVIAQENGRPFEARMIAKMFDISSKRKTTNRLTNPIESARMKESLAESMGFS